MKYVEEGSNSGYPLCDDEDDLMTEYEASHHKCQVCQEIRHESVLHTTTIGYVCEGCMAYMVKENLETPKII